MDTGKTCSWSYYGDTGYGGVMASHIISCSEKSSEAPRVKRAQNSEESKSEEADYSNIYGLTGYVTFMISSFWRYFATTISR